MMQRIFVFVIAAIIAYGCASTKKVVDVSIGTWDYVLKEIPNAGDVEGNFVIAKEGDNYTGSLNGDEGSTSLDDVTVIDKTLSCTFDYQGYTISMNGVFEGNGFIGKCSVEGYDFDMTATKRE